jgi:hypothetical protein
MHDVFVWLDVTAEAPMKSTIHKFEIQVLEH